MQLYSDSRGAESPNDLISVQVIQIRAGWNQATKILKPSYNTEGWHLLKNEVSDWLHDTLGHPFYFAGRLDLRAFSISNQLWCFRYSYVSESGDTDEMVYSLYFKNPDHAMMFKLVWGGSI